MNKSLPLNLLILLLLFSCKQNESVFKSLDVSETGIGFVNKLDPDDSISILDFEYMYNGAGVALIDINNDDLQDILFTGNMVSARLYLNKGNLKFEDITERSGLLTDGWCYGATIVDINQDGFQDIYICKAGNRNTPASAMHNLFFINNGDGTFRESAASMGLDADEYDVQSLFLDYDKDGDLDLYLLRNACVAFNRNNIRLKEASGNGKSNDKLFRNDGGLKFTDISKESGITIEGYGLGLSLCDVNADNWPDIFVSNDFLSNDLLWVNNQDGTFTNRAAEFLRHQTYNSMGNDVADFNNDGLEDLMEVDMLPVNNRRRKLIVMGNRWDEFSQSLNAGYEPQYLRNTLHLNNGNGTFSEIGQFAGVNATEWSWGPLFADFDNDGLKDLFISNGFKEDVTNLDYIMYGRRAIFMGDGKSTREQRLAMLKSLPGLNVPNFLYKNNGDLTFSDVSADWGFNQPSYSNGAAYGDLDNDGDLDLVINNLDSLASVYENQLEKTNPDHKWLKVKLSGPMRNRDGVGAKVWIWQNKQMQYSFCSPTRGYLSSVQKDLHFGLKGQQIDSVKVLWPDGKVQVIEEVRANSTLKLDYQNSYSMETEATTEYPTPNLLFSEAESVSGLNYIHEEDPYVDFKTQPLLPHMHSRNGPGLAVADINADGLDDFFIGAAAGQTGVLFIQKTNGNFNEHPLGSINSADDMGALFFDADGDGDRDLYVVKGGALQHKKGNPVYQDKLYLNNGSGKFQEFKDLPVLSESGASVIADDYDRDGDLDLFIAGRLSPGEYPVPAKSTLLRNDTKGGQIKFTDVSKTELPDGGAIGMVSSAIWTDTDNDGWRELVLVGEFMPVTVLKNAKGRFIKSAIETFENTSGWWNSIAGGDFDKDGDIDFVAGNLGLNSWFKASVREPVTVYAKDFDKNGRIDPFISSYVQGTEHLIHSRDDINAQIPLMKIKFIDYSGYAEASRKDVLGEVDIRDALRLQAKVFASAYIENLGGGKFKTHQLPSSAQFSPIYGILTGDFNNDGNLDVICAGNSNSAEIQQGFYDAQGLLVLTGDGKGKFEADRKQLNPRSDNKAIVQLRSASGKSLFLVSANSGKLSTYQLTKNDNVLALNELDSHAVITESTGKNYKVEFYLGNSYLSQSSRTLVLPEKARSVTIYDSRGNKRTLKPGF